MLMIIIFIIIIVIIIIIIITVIHSFIHSGDLYSASSRDYYSEALPAQPRTKKKDLREMSFIILTY